GQGDKDHKPGDPIAKDNTGKKGKGKAGQEQGEDLYEEEISISEIIDMMLEDMNLPWLEKKDSVTEVETENVKWSDISEVGPLSNVDKKRTILENMKRNAKKGKAEIKKVTPGDTVGYNRAGKVNTDTTIATVRIGYADGYPRNQGNGKGAMLVKGHFAPVMGAVCMDMTMLNITGIDAKEGDEVIVFGADLPVTDLAEKAGTIPYEILTGISQRVNRMYYEE
ncbi:MAG: DUF444 family protein, partial [Ferruginibacter sp.]